MIRASIVDLARPLEQSVRQSESALLSVKRSPVGLFIILVSFLNEHL